MIYPEAAWDGHPCKHVADWEEHKRLERLERQARNAFLRKGR